MREGLASLRWACRRGMLELDLLLGQFLNDQFMALSLAERALFKTFLDYPDQDLIAWLLENKEPPYPPFFRLIKKIKKYALTATSAQTV